MRLLLTFLLAFQLFSLSAFAEEPAVHIDRIAVDISGITRPTVLHIQAFEGSTAVWEKWGHETNRLMRTGISLAQGQWLVFAARNGHRWHFVRTAPQGLFQFRYARGVSPPVLQLLFIKRNEN